MMSLEDNVFHLTQAIRDLTTEVSILNQSNGAVPPAKPVETTAAPTATATADKPAGRGRAKPAETNKSPVPAATAATPKAATDLTPEQKALGNQVRAAMTDLSKDQIDDILVKYTPDGKLSSISPDNWPLLIADAEALLAGGSDDSDPLKF